MDYLLALDGGGTKTDLALASLAGEVLAQARVGGSSRSRRSAAEVERELAQGLDQVLAQAAAPARACRAVCGGFASAANPDHQRFYHALLAARFPQAHIQVVPDAEIAWRGATAGADGLVVIAGTGSIAWGHYRGRLARAGGAGPGPGPDNDPGSADWLGRQAVAAGLLPAPSDANFAALAPALAPALAADPRARALLERAGLELARLLQRCADQLAWPDPIAYPVGGVFTHLPAVRAALARAWPHPLRPPLASPLAGALAAARALLAP